MDRNTSPDDVLEANVEKLVSSIEAELEMPAEEAERVASSLIAASSPSRPWRSIAAAAAVAAVLVAAALLLLSSGSNRGVAWADVVRHLDGVEALRCRFVEEILNKDGEREIHIGQMVFEDPDKVRAETWRHKGEVLPDPAPDQPDTILVMYPEGGGASWTQLVASPRIRHLQRYANKETGVRTRKVWRFGQAQHFWQIFNGVRNMAAESVGQKTIDGIPVVGFEAIYGELIDERFFNIPPNALVSVWAAESDGRPIEISFSGGTFHDGSTRRVCFTSIEWNPEIDPDLFSGKGFEGFETYFRDTEVLWFAKDQLRRDVNFVLPAVDGGPPILQSEDVIAVRFGQAVWMDGDAVGMRSKSIFFEVQLGPTDGARMREIYDSGNELTAYLNGEEVAGHHFEGKDGQTELMLFIDSLNITLEEFEERYLTE